jgi:hypothetical protein
MNILRISWCLYIIILGRRVVARRENKKSDDNNGHQHIRIVTSQSKLKTINHRGHQLIDKYKGKHWCEGIVRNIFFGIDIALGNAKTDDDLEQ